MDLLSRIYSGISRHFIRVEANILNPDNSLADNNPLPENLKFQRCADNAQDLIDILQRDIQNPERGREELSAALKFASTYFSTFRPDVAIAHIKNNLS